MTADDLRGALIGEIRSSGARRGEALDSIRELSRRYEVSKAVAEKAVRSLVEDGICYAEQGRGVFLAVDADDGLESRLVATSTVAVVFGYLEYPATDHHFYRQVYEGIQEWIVGNRCNVLKLYNWRRKTPSQKGAELSRFASGVDGLIALGVYSDEDCIRLRNTGLPLVAVDHDTELLGVDCAVLDDVPAFEELTKRTVDASSGKVFFVQVVYESGEDPSGGARLGIVKSAAERAGRGEVSVIALNADDASQDEERTGIIRDALASGDEGPAVIFEDEYMVARVAGQLASAGYESMRDYVLGYLGPADMPDKLAGIPATVAAMDFRALGRSGAELLGARMKQGAGRAVKRAIRGEVLEHQPQSVRR
jgi:DNA-binding LacI/PurR family transcriptional regulator